MSNAELVKKYIELPNGKEFSNSYVLLTDEEREALIKDESTVKIPIPKAKPATKAGFKISFSDERDFILEKYNKKGEKISSCIFLYPKFIIEMADGTAFDVDRKNLKTFIGSESISLKTNLMDTIDYDTLEQLSAYLKKDCFKTLFEKKLFSLPFGGVLSSFFRYYFASPTPHLNDFFEDVALNTPILKSITKYNEHFLYIAYQLWELNSDWYTDFIEKYKQSSMISVESGYTLLYGMRTAKIDERIKDVYLKFGKKINDYVCFDLYRQGFTKINLQTFYFLDFFKYSILPKDINADQSLLNLLSMNFNNSLPIFKIPVETLLQTMKRERLALGVVNSCSSYYYYGDKVIDYSEKYGFIMRTPDVGGGKYLYYFYRNGHFKRNLDPTEKKFIEDNYLRLS